MNKKSKILLTAAIVALLGFSAYYFKDSALFKGIIRTSEVRLTAEEIADSAMAPLGDVVVPIKAGDEDCPKDELCTWPLTAGKESSFRVIADANFAAPDEAGEWRSIEAGHDRIDITYNDDRTGYNVKFIDNSTMIETTPAAYTIDWGDGSDLVKEDMTELKVEENILENDFAIDVEEATVTYTVIDSEGRSDSVSFKVTPPPAPDSDFSDATCAAVISTNRLNVILNHDRRDLTGIKVVTTLKVGDSEYPAGSDKPLHVTGLLYSYAYAPPDIGDTDAVSVKIENPGSTEVLFTGEIECVLTTEVSAAASANIVLAAASDPGVLLPQISATPGSTVYFKAADTSDAMMVAIVPSDRTITSALLRITAEPAPAPDRPADDGSLPRRPADDGSLPPRTTAINAVCNSDKTTAAVGETITFTGTGSTGTYTSAVMDFGDDDIMRIGVSELSKVTGNTTHIYAAAGTYTFTIKLWGADDTGDSCEKTVTITTPVTITQKECADGLDNDSDGYIDLVDSGCTNSIDDDERTQTTTQKECADGRDNDGDGYIDYPADKGCTNAADDDEVDAKEPVVKPKTSDDDEISFGNCIKKNKKAKQFADIDDDDHGAEAIALHSRAKYVGEYAPAKGDFIFSGYMEDGERNFKPEKAITRAEFVKTVEIALCPIDKAIDDGDFDEDPVGYADTKDHWGAPYVNIAGNLGIVDKDKPTFNPNHPITKAEAVKIILEIDGTRLLEFDEDDNPFDDLDEDDWFADYAFSAYEWGMVEGRKTTSGKLNFDGNRYLSRLGAAILLYNYLVVADDIEEEDAPEPIKIKRITN